MKIKICKHFSKKDKLKQKLITTFTDTDIIVKKCIGLCKYCKKQPVAKTKHIQYKATSISKLIKKITRNR